LPDQQSTEERDASPLLTQLQLGDLVTVDLVGAVEDAHGADHRIGMAEAEILRHARAATGLDRGVQHIAHHVRCRDEVHLRLADRPHAVMDAVRPKTALGDLEAAPLAEQDRHRHADIGEADLGIAVRSVVEAEHRQPTDDLDPGRIYAAGES
jgi:hypothetical protein